MFIITQISLRKLKEYAEQNAEKIFTSRINEDGSIKPISEQMAIVSNRYMLLAAAIDDYINGAKNNENIKRYINELNIDCRQFIIS